MPGVHEGQLSPDRVEDPVDEGGHVPGGIGFGQEVVQQFHDVGRWPPIPGAGP